ncbi:hypothetical protein GCM10019071_15020 [Sphingobium fuliginis]|uniref:Uncharacterized protein n=1 Tax=Sphingobium fuliginis (strain ATCC 27551) TaxID=336203 RepID=A0ABQ1EUK6_SPHSA|nr:hypothetical protein GCM10019071_15020 [Sphingobium fuliginis]
MVRRVSWHGTYGDRERLPPLQIEAGPTREGDEAGAAPHDWAEGGGNGMRSDRLLLFYDSSLGGYSHQLLWRKSHILQIDAPNSTVANAPAPIIGGLLNQQHQEGGSRYETCELSIR